jgi:Zn-finger nucleic acid-binding protein
MNRVHFAGRSKVVLDVCHAHGWWFDAGELQRIVAFLRDEASAVVERAPRRDRVIEPDEQSLGRPPLELDRPPPRKWQALEPVAPPSTPETRAKVANAVVEFLFSVLLHH